MEKRKEGRNVGRVSEEEGRKKEEKEGVLGRTAHDSGGAHVSGDSDDGAAGTVLSENKGSSVARRRRG